MSRFAHILFALAVLIGPWGNARQILGHAPACSCGCEFAVLDACGCAAPGTPNYTNHPCSPSAPPHCDRGSGAALPGRTDTAQEDSIRTATSEGTREPSPWPAVLGLDSLHAQVTLPVLGTRIDTRQRPPSSGHERLSLLGVLRI